MRMVTCCWEKTLCDSVKYKNSPVGALMWARNAFCSGCRCLPLKVAPGVCGRGKERDIDEGGDTFCINAFISVCVFCIIAFIWPVELLIQHCSHHLWLSFTCLILYCITHFMSAAMWMCLSVFVSVCISVYLLGQLDCFFSPNTKSSVLTPQISLCIPCEQTDYTLEINNMPWSGGMCAHVSVRVWESMRACVCVVSASSKQSGFNDCGTLSSV